MKKLSIVVVFFIFCNALGQVNIDSLQNVLDKTIPNQKNFEKYILIITNNPPNKIEATQTIANWIINNPNSSMKIKARVYVNLGINYVDANDFKLAIKNIIKAEKIAEKHKFYEIQTQALNELSNVYMDNHQYQKAIEFNKKTIAIGMKHNIQRSLAIAKYNLAGNYLSTGYNNIDTVKMSLKIMLEGLDIMKKIKDTTNVIVFSNGISQAYNDMKDYKSGLKILNDVEPLIVKVNKNELFVTHFLRIGKIYNDKGEFNQALKNYDKGLPLALKYKMPRWVYNYYMCYAETYENLENYKLANKYNILYSEVRDSVLNEENFKVAIDLQNKYEKEKKEKEFLELKTINDKKTTLNKILIGSSFGLFLIGFLGYRNFRNKQKLQNLKISELEKDKQLLAIDAMLRGQEEERSRIAKDLHDGLGGLLSGTKLSFTNMKENLLLSPENALQFEKSLSMLDTTIADLRKVAHNLMPEALVKFGLNDALRDFCNSIQEASNCTVDYQKMGIERKIGNTAETFIYRIIQELVNNAVKHANAKEIMVQLTVENNQILITVEDDGKGYDQDKITKGAGLDNIAYRVQYLNGKIDTKTSTNNGTSINIELNV